VVAAARRRREVAVADAAENFRRLANHWRRDGGGAGGQGLRVRQLEIKWLLLLLVELGMSPQQTPQRISVVWLITGGGMAAARGQGHGCISARCKLPAAS